MSSQETRKISVSRLLYPRDGFGKQSWCLLMAQDENGQKLVACGMMSSAPSPGERFSVTGKIEIRNGKEQFRFTAYAPIFPTNSRDLLEYVCEMAVGFGTETAKRIWETYGDEWKVSDLTEIPGITRRKAEIFADAFNACNRRRDETEIMSWLISYGVSRAMRKAAFEKWGIATRSVVASDPYRLAELPHFGFADVDGGIRKQFGIDDADSRRINAAIFYCVGNITQDGNSVFTWETLYRDVYNRLGNVSPDRIVECVRELDGNGTLASFSRSCSFAIRKDYRNEKAIFEYVGNARGIADITRIVNTGKPFTSTQENAVIEACCRNFHVINGGAGTGKTTVIKSIVDTLEKRCEPCKLCALSGKASDRIRQATGHDASTIHSMLKIYDDSSADKTDVDLSQYSVIVDESSMIPSWLLKAIISAKPKRLVLIGDESQLPPIGAGQPFHDIVRIFGNSVTTLDKCFRNKASINAAASMIRNGMVPPRSSESYGERWRFITTATEQETFSKILDMVNNDEIDFCTDAILVCRKGHSEDEMRVCVNALNSAIQEAVNCNPFRCGTRFKLDDRVICTKNDRDIGIWNGTTGTIVGFEDDGTINVKTDDGKDVNIQLEFAENIQLAYAITVHKAQGSQYRKVVFAVLKSDSVMMLDRGMIYTAVTRAQNECVVIGDAWSFEKGIQKRRVRTTVMQELAFERAGDEDENEKESEDVLL